jgi:hypothetical protein
MTVIIQGKISEVLLLRFITNINCSVNVLANQAKSKCRT